jgi:hypothetical protein
MIDKGQKKVTPKTVSSTLLQSKKKYVADATKEEKRKCKIGLKICLSKCLTTINDCTVFFSCV